MNNSLVKECIGRLSPAGGRVPEVSTISVHFKKTISVGDHGERSTSILYNLSSVNELSLPP